MIDDKNMIMVVNKSHGMVAYDLPEFNNLHRTFNPGESKKIPYEELRALSYQRGGKILIEEYLTILDEEVVAELIGTVEPEYYYTAKEVEDLLIFGTLDQLEDCLNFAPAGILDMVKNKAVEIKLNAVDKRQLISEKFGMNLDRAIEFAMEDEVDKVEETKVRKAVTNKIETVDKQPSSTPVRKASPVKIVSK